MLRISPERLFLVIGKNPKGKSIGVGEPIISRKDGPTTINLPGMIFALEARIPKCGCPASQVVYKQPSL